MNSKLGIQAMQKASRSFTHRRFALRRLHSGERFEQGAGGATFRAS